jgi:uncharacterized protein (DUF4415 family)
MMVGASHSVKLVGKESGARVARVATKKVSAFSLDADLVEAIKRRSDDTDVPQSRIVNRALRSWLDSLEK